MYYLQFIRKTAMIGFILLLVFVFVFKIGLPTIFNEAKDLQNPRGIFYAWLFWSLPAWPVLWIIKSISYNIRLHKRHDDENIFVSFGSILWSDIRTSFDSIPNFFSIIFGKHKIIDDSPFHVFADFMEVLVAFIWILLMIFISVYGIMNFR